MKTVSVSFFKYTITVFLVTCYRHTGSIECANSLSLVYTPKSTAFRCTYAFFFD